MNIDRGLKVSKPTCEGNGNKDVPPVGRIATFFAIYAWPDASFSGLAKERSRWDRHLGSYHPFVPGSRAHLHPVGCIWHPALLQSSIPPKSPEGPLAALHSLLHQLAADKLLLNISHPVLMFSIYSMHFANVAEQISPLFLFHLLFLVHNVKLLRLQILTGNVSLQSQRVSITGLKFHYKMTQQFFFQLTKIKPIFWT